ncbi:hypothetical protein ONE63_007275 [Megalurothrips usitatus]|uniref:Alkyl transferase n=1 Tax=Megalurothrips usitatus TaxID=439358 RepID=A0AAV7XXZ3_9NEOP|nr:hypothetical protein ONE63_007275 [Megalurothrips usitatus]
MTWIQKMCSSAISCGRVPEHVAFIMDGNRRYAKKHKIPSSEGHAKGFDMLVKLMRWCSELGIREITAYAFSIANFKRSTDEVNDLMELCKQKFEQLLKDKEKLKADDVQYRILGRIELIPRDLRNVMAEVVLATKENGGLTVNIAFAYAARDDILQSVRQAVDGVVDGRVAPSHVTHELLSKALYTNESSIPDLVIRTSGEFRYSDFLLWQVSCSCLYITDALWPDLTLWNLIAALLHYQRHYQTLKDVRQLETQRIVKIANAELEDLIDRFGKSAVKKHNDWLFGQGN